MKQKSRSRFPGEKCSRGFHALLPMVVCAVPTQFILSFFHSEYYHQNALRVHLQAVFHPNANPDTGEITNKENSRLCLFP